MRDLGAAAAFYLETTLKPTRCRRHLVVERVAAGDGRSDAPESARRRCEVVQILGGIGNPGAEAARDPADAPAGEPRRRHGDAPAGTRRRGLGGRKRVMLKDRYVQEATALFKSVTLALVGIGAVSRRSCSPRAATSSRRRSSNRSSARGRRATSACASSTPPACRLDTAQRSGDQHGARPAQAGRARRRHRRRPAKDRGDSWRARWAAGSTC